MTKSKRYDMRGLNINERMKLVEQTIDGLIDENEENFRIDMLDDGVLLEDAEECLDSQRAEKAEWRKEVLADMRRFFEDGAPR
jgi:hypothetical protein